MEEAMFDNNYYKFSIYDNSSYKYVVEFEKAFHRGNLEGLSVKDRLHFIDKEDAEKWIKAVANLDKDETFFNFKIVEAA
jgi:hypothetical protein